MKDDHPYGVSGDPIHRTKDRATSGDQARTPTEEAASICAAHPGPWTLTPGAYVEYGPIVHSGQHKRIALDDLAALAMLVPALVAEVESLRTVDGYVAKILGEKKALAAEVAHLRAILEDRDADGRLSTALAQENARLRAELADTKGEARVLRERFELHRISVAASARSDTEERSCPECKNCPACGGSGRGDI